MDKMKLESVDTTAQNIQKIAELFPNCITETKDKNGNLKKAINFELLKQDLSKDIVDGKECYEFTWVGKKESIIEANKPIRKTLRPCKEESVNWDTTENLYIEGDNLEVLKLLQESYLGKVKMIYIDPPYNTGNDFIYKDDFKESQDEYENESGIIDDFGNRFVKNTDSNGRFHSDWCSMIYSRLMLARNLIKKDGVILINIDEHEYTNLQQVCNEIFGESNDLGTIVWDKRNPKGDAKGISYQHEYILVYSKNIFELTQTCKIERKKRNAELILNKAKQLFNKVDKFYTLEDANKDFQVWINKQSDFSGGEKAYNKIDELGKVYQSVSMSWPNKKKAPDDYFMPLIHPVTKKECPVPERGWRNPSSTMKTLLKDNLIVFGKDEQTQPRRKYLLEENMYENIPSLLYYGGSDTDLLSTLGIPFDTPKVTDICSAHIESFTKKDDIILDFFSGSATTAHAVMQLNAEDGGNRKFIMVQLPEPCDEKSEAFKAGYKNICEIGKERIRRAAKKIAEDNPNAKFDGGFRVFKVDDSNMKDVYYAPAEYSQSLLDKLESNIKDDRTDLDLFFGCILDWGLPLNLSYTSETIENCSVHTYSDNALIACFNDNIPESVIKEIAKRKPLRVVFRDSSFADTPSKINVTEIFKLLSPDTRVKVI